MPPNTIPTKSRNEPTAAKIGAHDGPGMCTPAGARGSTRCLPRRAGCARASRQNVTISTTMTSAKIATGRSAINPPQSGITNWAVKSRM
jgi:hypothetical protein